MTAKQPPPADYRDLVTDWTSADFWALPSTEIAQVIDDLRYLATYSLYMRAQDRDTMLTSILYTLERALAVDSPGLGLKD